MTILLLFQRLSKKILSYQTGQTLRVMSGDPSSPSAQPEGFVGEIACNEESNEIDPPWDRPTCHRNLPADDQSQKVKEGYGEEKDRSRDDVSLLAHLATSYSSNQGSVNCEVVSLNFKPPFASGFVTILDFSVKKSET